MKNTWKLFLPLFLATFFLPAARADLPDPPSSDDGSTFDGEPWMSVPDDEIQVPDAMTGVEQENCRDVILTSLNQNFGQTVFSKGNVQPIRMPGWEKTEYGFVRGGGYNIRVSGNFPHQEASDLGIHSGRYADVISFLTLGADASLHIPDSINGAQFFIHDNDRAQEVDHYDFVAHVDDGFAFLPIGLFEHLFEDVIGADTRDPCPQPD